MPAERAEALGMPTARPHFIPQEGSYLFAWHHPARPPVRRGAAVVLCPPLGSEYINVYRVWRMLAERLAGIGFDVLRFDYQGTGDSAGDLEAPGRPQAWLRDTDRVVAEARELTGSSNVALVGLRIGGMLALQAAAALGGVDRLVLWSPFRAGRTYVRELRILGGLSREEHVTEAPEGEDILAAGYILPGPIARALEEWDLDALPAAPARHVLLVDRDDRSPDPRVASCLEKLGVCVTRVRPQGTAEVLQEAGSATTPAALDAIAGWLGDWPTGGTPDARTKEARAKSSEVAHASGYHERAVRFGPTDRLFGVLSAPTEARGEPPAIIILNTGFEYRVGPHRFYVPLAREWAAQGHVVLRYDLGGIGDSMPPPGAAVNLAYPAHALDDAREAIGFMRAHAPGRKIILVGLCSGGWHAFCAAREGLPVDAIASVNTPFYLRDGLARTDAWTVYEDMGTFRRALGDPRRWARGMLSREAYVRFARLAATYVGQKVMGHIRTAVSGRPLEGLAGDIDRIRARGIASLFLFSRGDDGLAYFQLHAGQALGRRKTRAFLRHLVVDNAGHTFSPPAARRALREILLDFVVRQSAPMLSVIAAFG